MRKTSPKNSQGFTLVEMMMAMLVLTVGLLGLLQSIQVAFRHNLRNRVREEAVLLAEEQMNALRLNASSFRQSTTVRRAIGGGVSSYTVLRSVSPIGGNTSQLTVSVRWAFNNVTAVHEIATFKRM